MKYENQVITLLSEATKLNKADIKALLEKPPELKMGNYAFPCFSLSKKEKKSPDKIAEELLKKIKPNKKINKIERKGPYLNFFINSSLLNKKVIKNILEEKNTYGKTKQSKNKVMIEYPGPNTNKPLHLGHVRNMCLGQALCNILKSDGKKVIQTNINNDRGIHICKSMLAYQKFGKNNTPEKENLKSDFFVGKYYVLFTQKVKNKPELEDEARDLLHKWESKDLKTITLWKKMNKWAFKGFKETYKKFGIKFDKEYYESEMYEKGKKIVKEGLKNKVFYKDKTGAVIINLKKEGYGEKVLLRADGTTVYITQDIYLAKKRYYDFKYDKLIYVVATEQNYHFKVLFETLKKLKYSFADKCHHFAYGMVNLTTGKMKSREGTIVDADTLINELKGFAKKEIMKRHKLTKKEMDERSEKIAMAAIRFYLTKYDSVKDILFNPKESISFEGETGPYIQYAHARCSSILRKNKEKIVKVKYSMLKTPLEQKIINLLSSYPEIVKKASESYKPFLIARYLLELSQTFNEYYHKHRVLKEEPITRNARLKLISAIKQVLKNGSSLLGFEAIDEM